MKLITLVLLTLLLAPTAWSHGPQTVEVDVVYYHFPREKQRQQFIENTLKIIADLKCRPDSKVDVYTRMNGEKQFAAAVAGTLTCDIFHNDFTQADLPEGMKLEDLYQFPTHIKIVSEFTDDPKSRWDSAVFVFDLIDLDPEQNERIIGTYKFRGTKLEYKNAGRRHKDGRMNGDFSYFNPNLPGNGQKTEVTLPQRK
jgi:hypothetical protein